MKEEEVAEEKGKNHALLNNYISHLYRMHMSFNLFKSKNIKYSHYGLKSASSSEFIDSVNIYQSLL
jgi:hypothetical protein